MRSALLILLFGGLLGAAEPSAFGAGNLDSDSPYGLTESEKYILKNKKALENVKELSRSTESQVESLRERLDGMQSVVEGLGEKSYANRKAVDELKNTQMLEQSENRETLKALAASVKSNEANILQLKKVLDDFSGLLDRINGNYVTKDEYNKLIREINDFKKAVSGSMKKLSTGSGSDAGSSLEKMSNAEVAKEAESLFDRERYTQAIEYYEHLIGKNYRPARAHYMIGEMWYNRKNYAKAIAYFKKSAQLYSKANYMPKLMLHTAISMEATNDIKNAKTFYSGVVAQYPKSDEAAAAAKRLKAL